MRYRLLGRSGLRVSQLCLGAMTFGDGWGWGADKETSRAIFDVFAQAGGNFIDTAYVYTDGTSEQYIGDFIASDRDHFVVGTKYSSSLDGDISKAGNSRKNMMRSVELSLRRLKTDYIDLLWLHTWDGTTPIEEILRGFDDLVRSGKVHYVGISDTAAWRISRGCAIADFYGWAPIVAVQLAYNLVARSAERDLLPMARELGLGVTAWSPLAGGILSGKYTSGGSSVGGRLEAARLKPRELEIATVLGEAASELGCSPSQLGLAWLLDNPAFADAIPIVGARSADQMHENLGCLDLTVPAAVRDRLADVSAIELGFPHELLASEINARFTLTGPTSPLIR